MNEFVEKYKNIKIGSTIRVKKKYADVVPPNALLYILTEENLFTVENIQEFDSFALISVEEIDDALEYEHIKLRSERIINCPRKY